MQWEGLRAWACVGESGDGDSATCIPLHCHVRRHTCQPRECGARVACRERAGPTQWHGTRPGDGVLSILGRREKGAQGKVAVKGGGDGAKTLSAGKKRS